ncbi:nitrite reductase small subunit NirD [Dermatobacter hominis]|uniref:nitrite reductase small subunit NirD n=1 Tax=Dermatobacter hominis TaxID=2884263 RepID=UPI001D0F9541|nr:nitrite reductase small subunit NirD [Dermatobacter hominis]UDY35151.1 nitrite reductase small subunit NirD [Dermatobacter hominis]
MTVATDRWTGVCALDDLVADRGVAALVDGRHVAVFRLSGTGELFAIDNVDPFAAASVLSRGLVGAAEVDGRWEPYVASPLRKQRFLLRDGACLDDPSVQVATFGVRVEAGVVEVAPSP